MRWVALVLWLVVFTLSLLHTTSAAGPSCPSPRDDLAALLLANTAGWLLTDLPDTTALCIRGQWSGAAPATTSPVLLLATLYFSGNSTCKLTWNT